MPLFRNIHHNPEFFADPGNFDPFRFEVRNATPVKVYTHVHDLCRSGNRSVRMCVKISLFIVQNPPKPNTYMPFGNGIHACPGNEFAKLEMLVLLHHMLTKYRYDVNTSTFI